MTSNQPDIPALGSVGESLTRRAAAALDDAALVVAMRRRDVRAWGEWDVRFRTVLDEYARRIGVPRWDAAVCVNEVLETEGMRFAFGTSPLPTNLASYMCIAVRNRYRTQRRLAERRERKHSAAADAGAGRSIVETVASQSAIRDAQSPYWDEPQALALVRLVEWLERELSPDERELLAWIAEQVPRRTIGEWLGITCEAAKKRCVRLCQKLQTLTAQYAHGASSEDFTVLSAYFERWRPIRRRTVGGAR